MSSRGTPPAGRRAGHPWSARAVAGGSSSAGGAGPAGLLELGPGLLLVGHCGEPLLKQRAYLHVFWEGLERMFQLTPVTSEFVRGQGVHRVRRLLDVNGLGGHG